MVQNELNHLRKEATQEEIGKLDFETFRHHKGNCCIYGQMTGGCLSERALELQKKEFLMIHAPTRFSSYNKVRGGKVYPFQTMHTSVIGVPDGLKDLTALELYLFMANLKGHKMVIAYLQSKTDTINLESYLI